MFRLKNRNRLSKRHQAIDNLIQSSSVDDKYFRLEWISGSNFTYVDSRVCVADQTIHLASGKYPKGAMLLSLEYDKNTTPNFVNEFARKYSLPTFRLEDDTSPNQFRRYKKWLSERNKLIKGFTKYEDNYYMVADKLFYHCYSLYGFCSACGILRCSPVWCICGYKQLSDGWTSNNHKLDDFIKKSQLQTNSPNDAYLEWIPFDCIKDMGTYAELYGLPIHNDVIVKVIPLEITDETHDLYYAELCDKHPDILTTNIWVTIGFTYDTKEQKYCLIKDHYGHELCLACTNQLNPKINTFCYECKAPRPLNWTTGNKSLDSFVMESWKKNEYDFRIQWIDYRLLKNVQAMALLRHGCTHIADWLEPTENKSIKVTFKKIVDERNGQSFDFYQLTKDYPEILTPNNRYIIGVTQKPSTGDYYLVFYHDMNAILKKNLRTDEDIKFIQYTNFCDIAEIGSGGYGTVYAAKDKSTSALVVLKRFKNFDRMPHLFISELVNHAKSANYGKRVSYARSLNNSFLEIYGFTEKPETNECMIVMQYANDGDLLSYLNRNINKMTWKMKVQCLMDIASNLRDIHFNELVHCDLHGGNIVFNTDSDSSYPLICDLGLSQSKLSEQTSTIRGVIPYIAPEVFDSRKFTTKSDIYAFGIIMYLVASGEPPFRNRSFDRDLVCDIMGGLRPSMPDSAPEAYKKLAATCCDADPNRRPTEWSLLMRLSELITEANGPGNDVWNTIYHTEVRALSRLEKESKYSSKVLPVGNLPKPRNNHDLDSAAATQDLV